VHGKKGAQLFCRPKAKNSGYPYYSPISGVDSVGTVAIPFVAARLNFSGQGDDEITGDLMPVVASIIVEILVILKVCLLSQK
jgi:hypothetical protein